MAQAKIKDELFRKCDSVILVGPSRTSCYSGFKHNPLLPCKLCHGSTQVLVNDRWWMIDPTEWHIIDKEDRYPVMFERKTNRKYNQKMRNVIPKVAKARSAWRPSRKQSETEAVSREFMAVMLRGLGNKGGCEDVRQTRPY